MASAAARNSAGAPPTLALKRLGAPSRARRSRCAVFAILLAVVGQHRRRAALLLRSVADGGERRDAGAGRRSGRPSSSCRAASTCRPAR